MACQDFSRLIYCRCVCVSNPHPSNFNTELPLHKPVVGFSRLLLATISSIPTPAMIPLLQKLKSSPLGVALLKTSKILPRTGYRTVNVPKMRRMIWDIMDEARRKDTIHISFDLELAGIQTQMEKYSAHCGIRVTLTTYIAKVLADSVAAEPEMQAYLNSKRQLVVFEDVDLSVMTERKIDGTRLPVPFVIRAANRKGLVEIDAAMKEARRKPLHTGRGPVSALESQFFSLPRIVRKIIWFFIRRDPRLFKAVAGTVALTSLPWKIDGRGIGWGISPMTLTLIIGATSNKVVLIEGKVVEQKVLQLNFSADHNVIDAAPLSRFIARFKKRLVTDLADAPPPAAVQPDQA